MYYYRFEFDGGAYLTTEDANFASNFAQLVTQYGLPTGCFRSSPIL
jgi:hypothetical protein